MHGKPQLSIDFTHFPYLNPEAPEGGTLVLGESGSFNSTNPYVLKGRAPWLVGRLTAESLLTRNFAEPFTLYGLLAETVEVPDDRSWVAFTLRESARFSDGSPVTAEDVVWSFETLGTKGHPVYRNAWKGVREISITGPRTVRLDLAEPNRELPLILGLRPILKKAQFDGRDFEESDDIQIVGSGPYVIDKLELGRFIEFRKNTDWWAADLPATQGLHNFDRVRIEYFLNRDAMWEAVRTGAISLFQDTDPVRWAESYDFPAMQDGTLERGEIAHGRPTGMDGFAFNTRREMFADRRVREALALTLDWEWINDRLYRGQYSRAESYFANSVLGFDGAASGEEATLLAPFAGSLPEGTLQEGWRPPVSDGTGQDRRNLRRASRMLDAAGWGLQDGVRRNADGTPLAFEMIVKRSDHETLASLWRETLAQIGVELTVRLIDEAQYTLRLQDYDYDMTYYQRRMSLSPGLEQRYYFGSEGRDQPGTRNYMGVADPATDAMIDTMLTATGIEDFQAAVRAHDRVLSSQIYVIPLGVLPTDRLVWKKGFHRPDEASLYGWWDWWSGPGVWWYAP